MARMRYTLLSGILLLGAVTASADQASWGCFVCEVSAINPNVYYDHCVQVASGETGTGIYCRNVYLGDGVTLCQNSGGACLYVVVPVDPINHSVSLHPNPKMPEKVVHVF